MPILVKDYSWRQTESAVIIQIPLKGVHYSKADVFSFENYIKVHYSPFLFEVFLYANINNETSKCSLTESEVVFDLKKEECCMWETLESNLSKEEKRNLREEIIRKAQEKAKDDKEKRAVAKDELKRLAIRKQMDVDSKGRQYIQSIKDREKQQANEDIEKWKKEQAIAYAVASDDDTESEILAVKQDQQSGVIEEINEEKSEVPQTPVETPKEKPKKEIKQSPTVPFYQKQKILKRNQIFDTVEDKPVPLPRKNGVINFTFTPRSFPTPSRESFKAEEDEWLRKQAEFRRTVGFSVDDLKPEEQNPIWLKDKGDSFFQMGNYHGAISAYSHALKIGSTLPSIYSNRAAAHLALGNYVKAHEDSTSALELLTPCVAMNAKSRARCHVRRAKALCHLGAPKHALSDLQAALALEPDDASIKEDIEKVRAQLSKADSSSDEG